MMIQVAKIIGTGLATTGLTSAGVVAIGLVFGALILVALNRSLRGQLIILIFASSKVIGLLAITFGELLVGSQLIKEYRDNITLLLENIIYLVYSVCFWTIISGPIITYYLQLNSNVNIFFDAFLFFYLIFLLFNLKSFIYELLLYTFFICLEFISIFSTDRLAITEYSSYFLLFRTFLDAREAQKVLKGTYMRMSRSDLSNLWGQTQIRKEQTQFLITKWEYGFSTGRYLIDGAHGWSGHCDTVDHIQDLKNDLQIWQGIERATVAAMDLL